MRRQLWVAFLTTASATAFELERTGDGTALRWNTEQIVYTIESQGMPNTVGGDAADAVREAFSTWDLMGPEIYFAEEEALGRTNPEDVSGDGHNQVLWPTYWDDAPERLAHTIVRYGGNDRIMEADILLNPDVHWAVLDQPQSETITETGERLHDVQNVVAHELGHFVGLAHSVLDDATMYPSSSAGETEKRDLSADDMDGYSYLYAGLEMDDSPTATRANMGCSAAPQPGVFSFWLLLPLLPLLRRRATALVRCCSQPVSPVQLT